MTSKIVSIPEKESGPVQKLAFSLGFVWGTTKDQAVRHHNASRTKFYLETKEIYVGDTRSSDNNVTAEEAIKILRYCFKSTLESDKIDFDSLIEDYEIMLDTNN